MTRVHILKAPAKSSTATVEFPFYNDAIAYARKTAPQSPAKPYRRGATWHVAVRIVRTDKAQYQTFEKAPGYMGCFPIIARLEWDDECNSLSFRGNEKKRVYTSSIESDDDKQPENPNAYKDQTSSHVQARRPRNRFA